MSEPVDYIELNLSNYSEDDVSQLNEWGIWASARIPELEAELVELRTLQPFQARRRGAIEALKKISEWAFECMEGEDASGFVAYENCHVTCENLIDRYREGSEAFDVGKAREFANKMDALRARKPKGR